MSTAHGSPAQRQRRRRQSDEPNADDRSTVYDVDVDLRWGATVATTTTTTSSLQRQRRQRDRPWVTGFGFGLCIGDFFFLDKHLCALSSVLVVWFAEFWFWFAVVLGNGVWSLPATWWDFYRRQRRDGFDFSFSVFFLLRIRGLAVSELPVMGSPWASLAVGYWAWFSYIYIYIYISDRLSCGPSWRQETTNNKFHIPC